MGKKESFSPQISPKKMSGKLSAKIRIKKDYVRVDGTSALFLYVYMDGKKKRVPLDINVPIKSFSETKQRIKGNTKNINDSNIYLDKVLSSIHNIELEYRLRDQYLNLDILLQEFKNPSPKIDFLKFYKVQLEKQLGIIKKSTYIQQKSTLNKLKKWKTSILFKEINQDLINDLIAYSRNTLKNGNQTISTTLKNFKKYLHIANDKGITTELPYNKIKIKRFESQRTFLDDIELNRLYEYYQSIFIRKSHKNVLQRFLFSCFTGLRISDVQSIGNKNIAGGVLFFNAYKTDKIQSLKLNKSALKFINKNGKLFSGTYTDQRINEVLKEIATATGITKNVTFHVARHTFATQWILNGGDVVNLQAALGHSDIAETMLYVHLVESVTDEQIGLLDNILKKTK